MTQQTLEVRVARLEQQVNLLMGERPDGNRAGVDDWKQTVGMFRGDPVVGEMIDESRRLREEDRRRARETTEPDPA
jgi:hypothetical protein